MKIKSLRMHEFRRFEDLTIKNLPPAKLVVLAGANGVGKSSVFDAFSLLRQHQVGIEWHPSYHLRQDSKNTHMNAVKAEFHEDRPMSPISFYLRTAYRNEPDFTLSQLFRQGDVTKEQRFSRMIQGDAAVSSNYARLASDAFEDVFSKEDPSTTVGDFRNKVVGELGSAVQRLFPDLTLNTLGNPLAAGTFTFTKGSQRGFLYENLSGGEKAAFDLILDLIVKRRAFTDTVFAIDEPEAHISTKLQGPLLGELVDLIPDNSQLWIATHSIGMMRKARDLYTQNPNDVVFLDFNGHDFDTPVVMQPVAPTRQFWENVLRVALDDLADLVAPREVVICEGNPVVPTPGANSEHDARCYATIFGNEYPDVIFISAGSSKEVVGDRMRFAAMIPKIAAGVSVRRVIDRDDHSDADVSDFSKEGIRVLSRRHIEAFLYDPEIIKILCETHGKGDEYDAIQQECDGAKHAAEIRGRPTDDIKAAANDIYKILIRRLGLRGQGNDQMSFARNALAPLIKPGTHTYQTLKQDVLG
ncbi:MULTISPECIES: AAA family ATPase [unclassified Ensifer]|uniref:AAA family ATPase n=1 Tax=unclassified Ensifer TaxID=2633371 RepID=UPI000813715E|nr:MULTISPECIES: AAA family ATPase [unclassified Ensifer]OCP04983.1 hypothetical protein BC362_14575 [Ensifer sp. LC14]OCP11858.1 hypothetical protein BC374_16430 [Ensifer sp. LC13]OCP12415.1 hypothetical protein BBX50_16630 [Ensifer sp. LC11]OCP33618.1 hypothetical protein BC364_15215 [Ensifer sp. LC499]